MGRIQLGGGGGADACGDVTLLSSVAAPPMVLDGKDSIRVEMGEIAQQQGMSTWMWSCD